MKRVPTPLLVGMLVVAGIVSVHAYQSHYGPSGLLYYDEAKSYGGYTLFTTQRTGPAPDFTHNATYLIDMEGNVVNTWPLPKYGYTIEKHAHLLDNGNLLRRISNSTWEHGWEDSWPGTNPAAASRRASSTPTPRATHANDCARRTCSSPTSPRVAPRASAAAPPRRARRSAC